MLAQSATTGFYTWGTLGTLAGASAATLLVSNVAGSLLGKPTVKKWIALIAAMGISIGLLLGAANERQSYDWIVAVVNGLLIFATAIGLNEMAAGAANVRQRSRRVEALSRTSTTTRAKFLTTWFGTPREARIVADARA
jgi:hypothetical protein